MATIPTKAYGATGSVFSKLGPMTIERTPPLGYNSQAQDTYVAITGQAMIVNDRQRIKDLWSEGLRGFFPQGSDDPNLTLLRVNINNGEFWDVPSNALLRAYAYVKAVATGERHQPSPDEQAKVQA